LPARIVGARDGRVTKNPSIGGNCENHGAARMQIEQIRRQDMLNARARESRKGHSPHPDAADRDAGFGRTPSTACVAG
jgi:hypothetical protein